MKLTLPTARLVRDSILFAVGLFGVAVGIVRGDTTMALAFLGLLSSPLIIRPDETRRAQAIADADDDNPRPQEIRE